MLRGIADFVTMHREWPGVVPEYINWMSDRLFILRGRITKNFFKDYIAERVRIMNEDATRFLVRVFERLRRRGRTRLLVGQQLHGIHEKFHISRVEEFEIEEIETRQGAGVMREQALSLFYFRCAESMRLERIREMGFPGEERYVELEISVRSMIISHHNMKFLYF